MSELFTSNFESYQDTDLYDQQHFHYQKDFALIFEYAKHASTTIIDLACGTGRTAIPLAKMGIDITGVDLHDGMIEKAKKNGKHHKVKINWQHQNITDLELPFQTDFIYMTGNSFQHFLTNESQNQLFETVYKHLLPGGKFLFNTRNPSAEMLADEDELLESDHIITKNYERYDYITQLLTCCTATYSKHTQALINEKKITLRYTYIQELRRLISSQKFCLNHIYGNWEKRSLNENCEEIIFICEKI